MAVVTARVIESGALGSHEELMVMIMDYMTRSAMHIYTSTCIE